MYEARREEEEEEQNSRSGLLPKLKQRYVKGGISYGDDFQKYFITQTLADFEG